MLYVVVHRIAEPRNFRIESFFGDSYVLQTFFDTEGFDKPVDSRMLNRFVNVVEINFIAVVAVHSFQPGSICKKRRSGQTPEHNDNMFAAKVLEVHFFAVFIERDQAVDG